MPMWGAMETNESIEECAGSLDECRDRVDRLSRDLVALRQREKKLYRRLYFDEKTGLPNHAFFARNIERLVHRLRDTNSKFAIAFINLDESYDMLEKANKSVLSEWVLYRTAISIQDIVRGAGSVYQTKSDEFGLLVDDASNSGKLQDLLDLILESVASLHRFPGQTISIGCSIGCAIHPEHGLTSGDLLRNADIALAFSRKLGRNGLVYDPSMSREISEGVALKEGMLSALEEQAQVELEAQFQLAYQPLVRVTDIIEGDIRAETIGSECLLRWRHPERGSIEPKRFIPVAEENGLIIPIGNWVFYRAAEKIRRWRSLGHESLFLSVNLSPAQFSDVKLIDNISRLLDHQELPPDALHVEVTETAVMEDPEEALKKIDMLHEMGIRLSIDDFGTGYSSLGYLRDLRVHTLKIDKSFIDDLADNEYDRGIVRAIVSMAHSLNVEVLAEGVEHEKQVSVLYDMGCRVFQGFYFSNPLSDMKFEAYLKTG